MEIKAINVPLPPPPATADFSQQREIVPPVEPVQRTAVDRDLPEDRQRPLNREFHNGDLQFRIDVDTDKLVVSLLDQEGEVVRQIPAETVLRIARQISAMMERGSLGVDSLA